LDDALVSSADLVFHLFVHSLDCAPSGTEWQAIANTTREGYTGHEQIDNVMVVHMNGRVFDPVIGRFLSADPFVDGPETTQGWNRYAYVHGRVVSATDPSGFCVMNQASEPNPDLVGSFLGFMSSPIFISTRPGGILTGSLPDIGGRSGPGLLGNWSGCIPESALSYVAQYQANQGNIGAGSSAPPPVTTPSSPPTGGQTSGGATSGGGNAPQSQQQCMRTVGDGEFGFNDFVDFSAGLGDALLLGFGDALRDQMGIGSVDTYSGAYSAGSWTSFGFGAGRLGYAAVAKGYSIAASSGAAASAFRASMRMPGAPVRDLTKYGTDAALRAAAGRTNPFVNAAGAGVAAAGAHGATAGCP
jgi:RHS repeat-associated protein